jgi:hypothetical protein
MAAVKVLLILTSHIDKPENDDNVYKLVRHTDNGNYTFPLCAGVYLTPVVVFVQALTYVHSDHQMWHTNQSPCVETL